jgi:hypothetical protein
MLYSTYGTCPNCGGYHSQYDEIYVCQKGHVFCLYCAPDWRGDQPYCAVCQDAAHERFFAVLSARGLDAALAEFDPGSSKRALYKECIRAGIDVAWYNGDIYPVGDWLGNCLVFDGVSLQNYLLFLCRSFLVVPDGVPTPQDFAHLFEVRGWSDDLFGVFEAPSGGRGWVYETSYRRLFYIPTSSSSGAIFCTGLGVFYVRYDSAQFRQTLTSFFGVPRRARLPNVGNIEWLSRVDSHVARMANVRFWKLAE